MKRDYQQGHYTVVSRGGNTESGKTSQDMDRKRETRSYRKRLHHANGPGYYQRQTEIVLYCIVLYLNTCYSAPARFPFKGAPDYCADAESEFHAEAHEQLRVKDLPRVPTRRL